MHVYKITNIVNSKIYIGKANDPQKRLSSHLHSALYSVSPYNKKYYIHNAIKKYGWDNFTFEIIEYCMSEDEAYILEAMWIKFYDSNNRNKGYNLTAGGRGGIRAESVLGNKNSFYGKRHTEETRARLRISQKIRFEREKIIGRKPDSPETTQKRKDAKKRIDEYEKIQGISRVSEESKRKQSITLKITWAKRKAQMPPKPEKIKKTKEEKAQCIKNFWDKKRQERFGFASVFSDEHRIKISIGKKLAFQRNEFAKEREVILQELNLSKINNTKDDNVKKQILYLASLNIFSGLQIAEAFNLSLNRIYYVLKNYKSGVPSKEQRRLNKLQGVKSSANTRRGISPSKDIIKKRKIAIEEAKQKRIAQGLPAGHNEQAIQHMRDSWMQRNAKSIENFGHGLLQSQNFRDKISKTKKIKNQKLEFAEQRAEILKNMGLPVKVDSVKDDNIKKQILELFKYDFFSRQQIAEAFGINKGMVRSVFRTYSDGIPDRDPNAEERNRVLKEKGLPKYYGSVADDKVKQIVLDLLKLNIFTYVQIAKALGLTKYMVSNVKRTYLEEGIPTQEEKNKAFKERNEKLQIGHKQWRLKLKQENE